MSDITVKRGDTHNRNINIKNNEGIFIDCSGWIIKFTVRKFIPSTSIVNDTDALISKTMEGTQSGIIPLLLTSEDTNKDIGNWYYDIQVTKPDGTYSCDIGRFIITADITRG